MFGRISIYESKERWKIGLIAVLILIVVTSIVYTNYLAKKLAREERKKIELLATVYKKLSAADQNLDVDFMFEIIQSNETVPLILTDKNNNIIAYRNIDSLTASHDSTYLRRMFASMKSEKEPIKIKLTDNNYQLIYYKDSYLLTQLFYFPYIQFFIIGLFMLVAYFAFSSSRRAEQNRVWVGMAKETAHQLGTPLNSLGGWVEYLRDKLQPEMGEKVLPEMEKDIERLVTVTERFSKIGAAASLTDNDIKSITEKSINYIKARASDKVEWVYTFNGNENYNAKINAPLFEWVIENLLKNALDAMNGEGKINISLERTDGKIYLDVADSGKGIPSNKFKKVFKPGYSTKQRGWGLGLSLSKRIIEEYHAGKIFVKDSQLNKGTTFRIIIPLAPKG